MSNSKNRERRQSSFDKSKAINSKFKIVILTIFKIEKQFTNYTKNNTITKLERFLQRRT